MRFQTIATDRGMVAIQPQALPLMKEIKIRRTEGGHLAGFSVPPSEMVEWISGPPRGGVECDATGDCSRTLGDI